MCNFTGLYTSIFHSKPSESWQKYDEVDRQVVAVLGKETRADEEEISRLARVINDIFVNNHENSKLGERIKKDIKELPMDRLFHINCMRNEIIEFLHLESELQKRAKKQPTLTKACGSGNLNRVEQLLISDSTNVNTVPCFQIVESLLKAMEKERINSKISYLQKENILRMFIDVGFNLFSYIRYLNKGFTSFDPNKSNSVKINKRELKPLQLRLLINSGISTVPFEASIRKHFSDREDLMITLFASSQLKEMTANHFINVQTAKDIHHSTKEIMKHQYLERKIRVFDDTLVKIFPLHIIAIIDGYQTGQEIIDGTEVYCTLSSDDMNIIERSYECCLRTLSALPYRQIDLRRAVDRFREIGDLNEPFLESEKSDDEEQPLEIWEKIYQKDKERRIIVQEKALSVRRAAERSVVQCDDFWRGEVPLPGSGLS